MTNMAAGPAQAVRLVWFWPDQYFGETWAWLTSTTWAWPPNIAWLDGSMMAIANVGVLSNLPEIPDRPHQPGQGFKFPKRSFGKKNVVLRSFQQSWFTQWPFLHYNESNCRTFRT